MAKVSNLFWINAIFLLGVWLGTLKPTVVIKPTNADNFLIMHSTSAITTGKMYYNDRFGNHWVTSDKDDEWRKWKDERFHEGLRP